MNCNKKVTRQYTSIINNTTVFIFITYSLETILTSVWMTLII